MNNVISDLNLRIKLKNINEIIDDDIIELGEFDKVDLLTIEEISKDSEQQLKVFDDFINENNKDTINIWFWVLPNDKIYDKIAYVN